MRPTCVGEVQRGAKPATNLAEYQEAASEGLSLVREGSFFCCRCVCSCVFVTVLTLLPWTRGTVCVIINIIIVVVVVVFVVVVVLAGGGGGGARG